MVFGMPTVRTPDRRSLWATPRVSSPPMATRQSMANRSMLDSSNAVRSAAGLKGFVREVPSMVPPSRSHERTRSSSSGTMCFLYISSVSIAVSQRPFQPSRIPMTSKSVLRLRLNIPFRALLTTDLMAALRPGQSPPPVNIPILVFMATFSPCSELWNPAIHARREVTRR